MLCLSEISWYADGYVYGSDTPLHTGKDLSNYQCSIVSSKIIQKKKLFLAFHRWVPIITPAITIIIISSLIVI